MINQPYPIFLLEKRKDAIKMRQDVIHVSLRFVAVLGYALFMLSFLK